MDIIEGIDLENCPKCYRAVQHMAFLPEDGVYFITCMDYDCGYTVADTNKERVINRWNGR